MRLSLSPEPEEWEQGRYRFRDDESSVESSEDEFVSVSHEECDFKYSESDGEYDDDYDHPLGFPAKPHHSWGKTRFSLDPNLTPDSIEEQWEQYPTSLLSSTTAVVHRFMQSYPPVQSYIDPQTASTASLLRYDDNIHRKKHMQQENDREMEEITQLLKGASLVDTVKLLGPPPVSDPNEKPLSSLADTPQDIRQKVAMEASRMKRHHQEAAADLEKLLIATQKEAQKILASEKARRDAEDRAEEARQQKIKAQQEADEAARIADDEKRKAAEAKIREEKAKERAARKAVEDEQRKKTEYLDRAKKLVEQLQQVRQSIEPFEKSKAVGKRRLNMKKIVRGKVNTLAENADKIKSVASEVGQAITAARAEDEEFKKQIAAGNAQIPPEMARGKRYLLDLLASSIIVRVQAEGFNGLRGDGFPIANMLALVSLENPELRPIMAAHIYTVCPTAIPRLPNPSPDASEEELMESLGMVKDKKGEYETFPRFLLRTEAIISLVANIMSANPPTHRLMDGHKGAVDWLERFFGHLPDASPLPLLTAPVLDAFLTGAGHMLANCHPEEFKKHLDIIQNTVMERLDRSDIGLPSATRLTKTLKEGFDGFKKNLPDKALKELYFTGDGSAANVSLPTPASGSQPTSTSTPFGSSTSSGTGAPSPFGGGGAGQSTSASNPFGGGGQQAGVSNPFGGGASTVAPSPFGGTSGSSGHNSGQAPSPFGGPSGNNSGQGASNLFGGGNNNQTSSFGTGSASATPFGQPQSGGMGGGNENSMQDESNQNNNPFGGKSSFGGPSPFGQSPAPGGGAFGGSASGNTPFGSSSMNTGSNNSSNPFGQASNSMSGGFGSAPAPSGGFGASNSNSMGGFGTSGGFGSSNTSTNPSPFGGGSSGGFGSTSPSPFGSAAPASGGFGSSNSGGGGFGAFGSGGNNQQQSPFGGGMNSQQQTPFGGGGINNQQQTPFGGGGMNNQQQSPFGGGGMNNQQQTPFGGGGRNNQQQQTPFGGGGRGGGKAPCKFFAKGNCRFGDKCRYSHSGGGGGNNTFGGGRF